MEKTLLKVSGVIAFVLGILACVTIIGAIVGVPLIIGGKKFMDLSNGTDVEILDNKDNILIWSIVFLFLCTIAGVLSLIFYIELQQNEKSSDVVEADFKENNNNLEDELTKLKKLYDDKLISKEEYDTKRKKVLGI